MSSPKISVITPAFKPVSIAAYLDSFAANASASTQWILVDDGSGSEFEDVFYEAASVGVQVIQLPENRRQSAARNAGLGAAQGDWIKFLDVDDRIDAGHLSALLRAAKPNGPIPFAPTVHLWPSGRTAKNETWRDVSNDAEAQLARLLTAPFLHHCGALFPKDLLRRLGGYNENLVTDEDGDLLIRLLLSGATFRAVPETQYFYIHHNSGHRVSADDDPRKLEAREWVCDDLMAHYETRDQDVPVLVRIALAQRLDSLALSAWESDEKIAKRLHARARVLCPDYPHNARLPIRIARALGGPRLANRLSAAARRFRGRSGHGMRA